MLAHRVRSEAATDDEPGRVPHTPMLRVGIFA
jgi:hypothetical protein